MIDKPILELLTFGSNPDFGGFGVFCTCFACFAYVLRMFCACFARVLEKLNFQAVIKSAASAASRETKNQGPRSRGAQPSPVVRMPSRRPWAPLDLGP